MEYHHQRATEKIENALCNFELSFTMARSTSPASRAPKAIFFHVSSLIGYVRVLLTTYSFYIAMDDYKTSVVCYSLSFVCDFFDGFVARELGQRMFPSECGGRRNSF
jgi:hypothetical protein